MSKERRVMAVQLKVAEAKQRDVGKDRARLDVDAMEAIGVTAGDALEIVGKRSTAAIAWPADPEDQWLGVIRIDGQTRKNCGVALNEYVTVRRTEVNIAKNIGLSPVSGKLSVDKEFVDFVKNRLKGFPLSVGDHVSVVILGNPIIFVVSKLRPPGVGRVEATSRLSILPEAAQRKKTGTGVTYEEIGGLKEEIRRMREIVELPLRHPEVFQRLGIEPPSGIMLYGPPGCGKTLLAKALANESEAEFFSVNGPEIMNKYYGETEARLREIFKEAKDNAPSIIFVDEIDAIAPRREEALGDVEKRVVAQLLALMDGLAERGNTVVIGATNRPEGVDPALRRPGRFDREVEVGVPNATGRLEILQIHTRGMPLSLDVDLKQIADETYGYTGADSRALCREAALKALRRYLPEIDLEAERIPPDVLQRMLVTSYDFREAQKEIVPTALREFYVEKPSVGWRDIGGLDAAKKVLDENVIWGIKYPDRFQKMGVKPPKGVLLYGPSGCGKTLLAKAVAKESGANFLTVRGPEILSKWVGESEKAMRGIFRKAKASAPCIVLLDEVDSIAKSRGLYGEDGGTSERVLSQLLTEMDASQSSSDVFVIAATNRPDLLDSSLMRGGRLDLLIYVSPPDEKERLEILRIYTSKMPISEDASLDEIAVLTKAYSGADLNAVCREAAIIAMKREEANGFVSRSDFQEALSKVRPSLTPESVNWYESIYKRIRSAPTQPQFFG